MRDGLLAETPMPTRPNPCAPVGRPAPTWFHVVPPSTDLYNPLAGPVNDPFSHGACRASHITAYTICAFDGSNATSAAPVFSSLYKTFSYVLPPSTERKTPRSAFGP